MGAKIIWGRALAFWPGIQDGPAAAAAMAPGVSRAALISPFYTHPRFWGVTLNLNRVPNEKGTGQLRLTPPPLTPPPLPEPLTRINKCKVS